MIPVHRGISRCITVSRYISGHITVYIPMHHRIYPGASQYISRCITVYIQVHHSVYSDASQYIFRSIPCITVYIPINSMHHSVYPGASLYISRAPQCIFRCITVYIPMHHSIYSDASQYIFRCITVYIPMHHSIYSDASQYIFQCITATYINSQPSKCCTRPSFCKGTDGLHAILIVPIEQLYSPLFTFSGARAPVPLKNNARATHGKSWSIRI